MRNWGEMVWRGSRFRESAGESEVPQGTPATATVSETRMVPPLEHFVLLASPPDPSASRFWNTGGSATKLSTCRRPWTCWRVLIAETLNVKGLKLHQWSASLPHVADGVEAE